MAKVSPEKLLKEYYLSKEKNNPTDKFINLLFQLAKNLSVIFYNYCKDDVNAAINYAVTESYYKKWFKFNPDRETKTKNSIFAFFTSTISNDMKKHLNYLTKGKNSSISIQTIYEANNK